ncbi:hypothetical protein ACH4GK_17800 [Streptomyces rimosus]|uniref:hypothetical protein n=1 Tax=Streptomyces rimosus TaxID=1927 RepID=UPI0007C52F17|nr:hypothetical protein [Streptomyces rimosus]
MDLTDEATRWAYANPYPAAIATATITAALAVAAWRVGRALSAMNRPPAAVLIASFAAAACTAYSADTSWRFAAHRLGMTDHSERLAMFAAAEIALLACGLLARANKKATAAADGTAGTPGVPGALVWVITGVQIIPAYAESGVVGGTVRAVIGPVLAGLLWHQAMGLELRIIRPGALSTGLPAQIARALRERLLSRLGLAVRDRTAEQISRDRALSRAVRLGSRRRLRGWGSRRLAAAVARAHVATDPVQRQRLMLELAARRGATELNTIALPSAWDPPQPPAQPRTPVALARQQLTEMHPLDAVRRVHAAHPDAHPAALASLLTEHGVVVSEQQVRVAIGAGNPPAAPRPDAPAAAAELPGALVLDITTEPEVHPEVRAPAFAIAADQRRDAVHARIPECASDTGRTHGDEAGPDAPDTGQPEPSAGRSGGDPDELPADLIERARALGRPASLRTLQRELRIGQVKAQRLQDLTREG